MINEFLKRLNPDFSNIDEVYSELLTTYNPDNINTSELTFINSVQYENVKHSENVPKLSMYLGAKSTTIDWQNIDYFNHYLKTGHFGFSLLHSFNSKTQKQKEIVGKTITYKEFISTLNTFKRQYDYIFNKLDKDGKDEFKFDFCDQLDKLKSKQTETKFKEAINDLIKSVNEAPQLKKTLLQFIHNIENKEAFLLSLKNAFPTEKGKSIKAVIDLLVNEDILIIGTKEFKHFVELLTDYFGRNIGTYNGIQNIKTIDKAISDPINTKLNPLIIIHKTT